MKSIPQTRSLRPGRPKDAAKRAAILKAAVSLFVRYAFTGTSMDAIAAEAGVSKLTVYSHFGNKDNLFHEVVRVCIQALFPEAIYRFDHSVDIRQTLLRVALAHVRIDCDQKTIGTFRAILSDCRHGNPRYGRIMWEEGPMRTHALMERLLQQAIDAGKLAEIVDVSRAATQFMALIKGNLVMRHLFGCMECDEDHVREMEANAHAGVSLFLRAYQFRLIEPR